MPTIKIDDIEYNTDTLSDEAKGQLQMHKLSIDEEYLIEIDAINLVRKVGGEDQMEAIRAAIGL